MTMMVARVNHRATKVKSVPPSTFTCVPNSEHYLSAAKGGQVLFHAAILVGEVRGFELILADLRAQRVSSILEQTGRHPCLKRKAGACTDIET